MKQEGNQQLSFIWENFFQLKKLMAAIELNDTDKRAMQVFTHQLLEEATQTSEKHVFSRETVRQLLLCDSKFRILFMLLSAPHEIDDDLIIREMLNTSDEEALEYYNESLKFSSRYSRRSLLNGEAKGGFLWEYPLGECVGHTRLRNTSETVAEYYHQLCKLGEYCVQRIESVGFRQGIGSLIVVDTKLRMLVEELIDERVIYLYPGKAALIWQVENYYQKYYIDQTLLVEPCEYEKDSLIFLGMKEDN